MTQMVMISFWGVENFILLKNMALVTNKCVSTILKLNTGLYLYEAQKHYTFCKMKIAHNFILIKSNFMCTKKIVVSICLLFAISFNAISQVAYFNYIDYDSEWEEYHIESNGTRTYYKLYVNGDSLIDNKWYYKINYFKVDTHVNQSINTSSGFTFYLREDVDKKFYSRNGFGEYILWNFNISQNNPISFSDSSFSSCNVMCIDTFHIGQEIRKKYLLDAMDNNMLYEGIGSVSGISGLVCALWMHESRYLKSFKNRNGIYYIPFPNSCDSNVIVSNVSKIQKNVSIEIYPNPATNEITIQSEKHNIQHVTLYDITSKAQDVTIEEDKEEAIIMNINTLNTGIYFCHIILANGQMIVKKVVKH